MQKLHEKPTHVRGDKHPLGKVVLGDILLEESEVFNVSTSSRAICHGVKNNQRTDLNDRH